MSLFFETETIGFIYLGMTVFTILYLIYLSVVDSKKHELEYWQTGLLFGVCLLELFTYVKSERTLLISHGTSPTEFWKYLIIHLSSGLLVFVLLLFMTFFKKNGKSAIGGADIWAITAISIMLGIFYLPYFLIATCLAYLIYALFYRIIKKEKLQRVAFLPFITIGTVFALGLTLL
ncbi:MAG: prepilin peptidase [Candidatus Gastranaerophilaceae bacterium]